MPPGKLKLLLWAVVAGLSLTASAQTIAITNGVQTYASLSGYTVNLSNRCELWVTSASTPLTGCTINLNSSDAWLFLPNVKPSVAAATYLSQVKVSGAAAVADNNCRVVQYGQNGAVVIPQASSFQPLTVFTGPEFSGTGTSYSQWVKYTGAGIANISSFKLKRGYQVVFAQSADGANWSKCYVAQDGDLEIGVLPATLDKQVQFIYVTPWRWTSKKGIAGDPPLSWLNVDWWYNWNINQTSSRDLEYAAIWQRANWPSLNQNWQSLGINTVLGYNEPDNSSPKPPSAYSDLTPAGSVTNAVARYPTQLTTGLRMGSPACTDGGVSSWLIPFVSQADTAGLRVDFVAQHYYQSHNPADAAGCASQMYNFLLNIWNQTHKPIWVTEWNNGANWTDSQWPVPTYAQQQADIQAMVNMLESTPFVERYALFNWVEDGRSLVDSNGAVTLAGTVYSNTISGLSYLQAMPDNGTRGVAEYLFATNAWDSSGYYNNAMTIGAPAYTTGHNSQASAIVLDGTNNYVQLPANIASAGGFTFAAWVYWNGGAQWQRIFDFGAISTSQGGTPTKYMFLTPNSGGTTLRFAIANGGSEQRVETGALAAGSWQHVAVTLNGSTAVLYVNGAQVSSASVTLTPSAFSPVKNYLGKSQFAADPLFGGKLDGVEITDYAMTAAQIAALYNGLPAPGYTGGTWALNGSGNWSTTNNWRGGIVATGACVMADFSAIDITGGPVVTLDSSRTIGGLRFGDASGAQSWTMVGANTLTLDGGASNVPEIAVDQNTATIYSSLAGANGFVKTGNGTLTLQNSVNAVGGGLTVKAGTLNLFVNSASSLGSGTSTIGYRTGSGTLAMTTATLSTGGELRVGGSDLNGTQYTATGTVTLVSSALNVGSLTVARGNNLDNSIYGTVTLNSGGTLICTNDAIVEYAGTGLGKLVLNGGNFILGPTATKWFMLGCYDTGAGELDIYSGNFFLENGSSLKLCRGGNTGGNVVNQNNGSVTFFSDAGTTPGGGGNLDLNYAGVATSTNTYNLNGGTLTVPQIKVTSGAGYGTFNFNGGTLKPTAASTAFMQGLTAANVKFGGAKIDTGGNDITIAQSLLAAGGGLTKNGAGKLTLTGVNTYTGTTTINAGTLALGGSGSISSSATINLVGGATLDVAGFSGGYTLGAGQTLKGDGNVTGAAVIQGIIAPGASLGTLAFDTAPVLNGTLVMEINRTNVPAADQLILSGGTLNYGGTLTVNNAGDPLQAGDAFQLFNAPAYGGNFAVTNLPVLGAGLAWSNSLAVNGTLAVIATVSQEPTNIVMSVSGTNLMLSWPADHTGWRLQANTNLAGTNWLDVDNSTNVYQVTLPIEPTNASLFYRLVYP